MRVRLLFLIILVSILSLHSCLGYKQLQVSEGTARDRIMNAIIDYTYTEKSLLNESSCFSIDTADNAKKVSITRALNKFEIMLEPLDSSAVLEFSIEDKYACYTDPINGEIILSISDFYESPVVWANPDKTKRTYIHFPSDVFVYQGKVFVLFNDSKPVTEEILSTLYSYDLVDTVVKVLLPIHPNYVIDDGATTVIYSFPSSNNKKYKKTRKKWF